MSNEKSALVTWSGGGHFGKEKLTVEQDAVGAVDPLKRELKGAAKEADFGEVVSVTDDVIDNTLPDAPPVPTQASPEEIYGQLAAAGGDTYAAEQVYATHNLDRFRFVSEMQPHEWISEISKQQSKAAKQNAIGASAAVVEGGAAPGSPSEAALEEMQAIYGGSMGSITQKHVAKRLQELNESMGKAAMP